MYLSMALATNPCQLEHACFIEVKICYYPSQCQAVSRNTLKSSPKIEINALLSRTNSGCNIECGQYRNAKYFLNASQNYHENHISHILKSQSVIISSMLLLKLHHKVD